jgi:hypothetical protein
MNNEKLQAFIKDIQQQYEYFEQASKDEGDEEYAKGSRDAYGYILDTLPEWMTEDE